MIGYTEPQPRRWHWYVATVALAGMLASAATIAGVTRIAGRAPHVGQLTAGRSRPGSPVFCLATGSGGATGAGRRTARRRTRGGSPAPGDIDTHGFGILNRLRANLREARSFLMDRATLQAHRALWGREPADRRYTGDTSRLTADECALFEDLLADRCGDRVRLEQERIGYGWLETALREWLTMG